MPMDADYNWINLSDIHNDWKLVPTRVEQIAVLLLPVNLLVSTYHLIKQHVNNDKFVKKGIQKIEFVGKQGL